MGALALLLLHPNAARTHINISGSARALPFSIAIRSLQREAIRLDPKWNHGHYDDEHLSRSRHAHGAQARRDHLSLRAGMGRALRPRAPGFGRRDDEEPFGLEVPGGELPRRPRAPLRAQLRPQLLPLPQPFDGLVRPRRIRRDGDVTAACAGSVSKTRWRSASPPTSCSRCSNSSRSPTACGPAARTPTSCRCHRRRATTRSWWTSRVSGRPSAISWQRL